MMEMQLVRGKDIRLLGVLAPSLDIPTRCYPHCLLPWLVNPLARIITSLSLGLLGGLKILVECSMANAESLYSLIPPRQATEHLASALTHIYVQNMQSSDLSGCKEPDLVSGALVRSTVKEQWC